MPKQSSTQDNNMSDLDQEAQAPESALEEGKVFDYITGKPVKDSDKEQVRQREAVWQHHQRRARKAATTSSGHGCTPSARATARSSRCV